MEGINVCLLCYNIKCEGVIVVKNIERGTIKHLVILIIMIAICGIIIYPFFDLIICKLLTHSKFIYSVKSHVIQPVISAVIAGTILWLLEKK